MAGGLPATFWWLWAGLLVNSLASFVYPFLVLSLVARGWSSEEAGLAVSVLGAGAILSAPLGGVLADAIGRRRTMLLSLGATALATFLLAFAASGAAIAATVALLGLVSQLFRPAAQALVADVVPSADRPRAFGLNYWAVNLGMAVSLVLGGALAHFSYRALFVADAATTALFAVLVWRRIPETRPAEAVRSAGSPWRGLSVAFRDRVFVAFLGLNVAFGLVLFQFMAAAPLDMARNGIGPLRYGLLMSVNGVAIAALQPFVPRWLARRERDVVLAAAALLLGAGYGLFGVVRGPAGYAAAILVWTIGEILYAPGAAAFSADMAPVALRGRYQGAFGMSWGIAATLAPAAGSSALARLGPAGLWGGCFALGLLAALGQLAARRSRRRRVQEMEAEGAQAPDARTA